MKLNELFEMQLTAEPYIVLHQSYNANDESKDVEWYDTWKVESLDEDSYHNYTTVGRGWTVKYAGYDLKKALAKLETTQASNDVDFDDEKSKFIHLFQKAGQRALQGLLTVWERSHTDDGENYHSTGIALKIK